MNKSFFLFLASVFIFFGFLNDAFSAELTFNVVSNLKADGDDVAIIEARINPQSKNLNVIEGVLSFQGLASDKLSVNVETGGSVLTLWTTSPNYISSEKSIRFVGGVPGGFKKEGLLFRMRIVSTISGPLSISWVGGMAYLNDGKGTQELISSKSITLNLNQLNQKTIDKSVSRDTTAPFFDALEIGKDQGLFDGKSFVSFHAVDDMSGVARYEVKEENTVTEVTNGIYLFKNQERRTPVTITVFDQAGNSAVKVLPARFFWFKYIIIVFVVVFILFLFQYVYRKKN